MCFRDKAGGYGIQALGGMLVEYVHGDFLNVVGFPLNHFCKQLDLIYNHWTSGTHTTLVPTQPMSSLPPQSSQISSSSAKHNSASPRPKSSSASQARQNSPSSSPVDKVSLSNKMCTFQCFFLNIYKQLSVLIGGQES